MNYLNKILVLFTVFLLSCNSDITEINKNPMKYEGKEVTIKGSVVSSTNLMLVKAYVVSDGKSEIYVQTDNAVPLENTKIKVKGFVKQLFKIGSVQIIGIKESSRNQE